MRGLQNWALIANILCQTRQVADFPAIEKNNSARTKRYCKILSSITFHLHIKRRLSIRIVICTVVVVRNVSSRVAELLTIGPMLVTPFSVNFQCRSPPNIHNAMGRIPRITDAHPNSPLLRLNEPGP